MAIRSLDAVTLAVRDMARAVRFYRSLGFELKYGGEESDFTSFRAGTGHLNLTALEGMRDWTGWGRAIFFVDDVDAQYARVLELVLAPHAAPRDAPWGERFFHVTDPDGHEISFARPIR